MSAGSHKEHFDQPDDERSALRKRWFEQVVMIPVAIGMLSTTVGFTTHDIIDRWFGQSPVGLDRPGMPLAIMSAAFAGAAFLIAAIRWRRR